MTVSNRQLDFSRGTLASVQNIVVQGINPSRTTLLQLTRRKKFNFEETSVREIIAMRQEKELKYLGLTLESKRGGLTNLKKKVTFSFEIRNKKNIIKVKKITLKPHNRC